ncbi:MAG: adenylate/guanylate cyclase domain-containing protein [Verrucomicrobia bacterium]|nr:adenylate/guanylate cyclase domain-containing protein [Verrucomicrobiota bacterium]
MNFRKLFAAPKGWGVGVLLGVGLGALLMLDIGAVFRLDKIGLGRLGGFGDRLGRRLQQLGYDLLFGPRPIKIPTEAIIVYLDEVSHRELKQPFDKAWDRSFHARLLDRLREDGAKAAVFDIVFADHFTNKVEDVEFARAIKEFGKAILAADWVREGEDQKAGEVTASGSTTILPQEVLLEHAAGVGTSETLPSPDLYVRQHFPGSPDALISSLSWTAAEFLGAEVTKHPELKFKQRWVNYYGPPLTLPRMSFHKAISTNAEERLKPGTFRDKIVFVGAGMITAFSGERKDEYRSPYALWTEGISGQKYYMPGVEIQATVTLNLMRGDWLTRVPYLTDLWMVLLAGLVFGFGLTKFRPVPATLIALASMAVIFFTEYYYFSHKLVWSAWFIIVGVQIPAATLWSIVFNSISLYVQGRLMEQSLSMYVSPQQVKKLKKNPAMLKPGAEKQQVSILFSDIANFTSMSEGMDSDQLADLMNNYFEISVGQCIHPARGTVVKFIGDAIFAIWNAPEPQGNHQELACQGGLLLRDTASKFTFGKSGRSVRTRIGLHCGVANVGNFGSSNRVDYTALGENINLASRMEGLNKYLGTDLLVTGDLYTGVQDKFVTRFCGRFQLKGFEKAVEVHELLGASDQAETSKAWREAYTEALKQYEKKDLEAAEAGFHCTLKLRPTDGPSQFFLKHLEELRSHPPDGEWTGVVELKEK